MLVGSYDNRLYCVNAADGQQRWAVETQGYVHCTTAVVPGGGGAGRTFIAGCDEHLRGVEVAGGAVTLDVAVGTYLIASPAAAGGRVYFGTHAGQVLAVDASADTEPGAAVAETDAVAWRAAGRASSPTRAAPRLPTTACSSPAATGSPRPSTGRPGKSVGPTG